MENNYQQILANNLFKGISPANLAAMLNCLGAYQKKYRKNTTILAEGEDIKFVGLVLAGAVKIIKSDYNGNQIIIAEIGEGDIFAEVFACAQIAASPVTIIAAAESIILFFDYRKIIATCSASCQFHQQLIANMLQIIAHKTLYLNRRIDIIAKRSLRDKILTYFNYEGLGKKEFSISLNREELADFLYADRSALSNELSKMKKDGLIDYHKNYFKILV